jgi:hypothetical protein
MRIEMYVVYTVTDDAASERDEIRRFKTFARAKEWAKQYTERHHVSTTIDWVLWEVSRSGRRTLDSDADLMAFSREGSTE